MLTTNRGEMDTIRYAGLKRILEERRRLLRSDVEDRIRDVRGHGSAGGSLREVLDGVEVSDADAQEEIELALIQIKAELLGKIDEALARLRDGAYGFCLECGEDISEKRLHALPFAVRCRACEESREAAQAERARQLTHRLYRRELPFAPAAV
jgi:DnaK suppressor protein